MKVFISWSGPQSNYIAQALRNWLRDVIQNLNPWMSEADITAGERWGERLWQELQDSQFGVVCLTAENLQSPWLHYEAGALAKAVNGRVCPYLYKIKPTTVQGPLSHHQTKQVDKQGTKELLHSINAVSLDSTKTGLRPEQLDKTFITWWPQLEDKLTAVPPSITPAPPRREMQEILEEILGIVRSQQARSIVRSQQARSIVRSQQARSIARQQGVFEQARSFVANESNEVLPEVLSGPSSMDNIIEKLNAGPIIKGLIKQILKPQSISGKSLLPSDTPRKRKAPPK